MYAVIFQAEINKLDSSYSEAVTRMRELAISRYGCVDFVSASEDNHEITISYWESDEQIRKWKNDPEHIKIQKLGQSKWYKSYKVQIAMIERDYRHNVDN